ncbi:peptidoglycan-binding domain-containing protein, partial [Agromyces bauzanensis]|uniref:peptidoglycan-binding domain-containing protein n=1 Tax=Agromyces bauzanensis TaxID=1308924 RepID=UPI0031E56BC7
PTVPPTSTPLAPAASVDRVKQADADFEAAQAAVTEQTTLADASEQFNSAVVALEMAWLRLFADAGCLTGGTVDKATAAALQAELVALGGAAAQESLTSTAAVQQTLKLVGFWDGAVDGVWTDDLTAAVQAFQTELGVEPTGAVDAATIAAFERAIAELTAADASPNPSATPTDAPASS